MNQVAALRQHPLAAALRAGLDRHRDALLQAPTGAGKSTLAPLALLAELGTAGRRILMLEPRRLAARAVAARMAALLGERTGATVGYRTRFDTRVSSATRIEVITEGVLTRLLNEDPSLEGVAWLIFDEYHERSLQGDLGLALALEARRELGTTFRLLIMSATLEVERAASLLEDAAVISVPGRAFPIDVRYLGRGPPLLPLAGARAGGDEQSRAMQRAAASAVAHALAQSNGDVLVFLPGAGEIQAVHGLLTAALPGAVQLLSLHGQMSAEAQDRVLTPAAPSERRVVLATNVAETSVTIPGITAVVDSGLARRARFDPVSGMSRLELTRISRAASEQRAGRAGRVGPGVCYRLWSEGAHASLAAVTTPEILEADLAPLALELARWGITDAARLRWLDAPPRAALEQARELLIRLDALDAAARLTPRGRQMADLPAHPRLAHMLLIARELNCVPLAARLAALLSERDLLRAGRGAASDSQAGAPRDPDIRTRLELLEGVTPGAVSEAALERARRVARALEGTVVGMTRPASGRGAQPRPAIGDVRAEDLPGALLALAFPDRIGQRREGSAGRYLLANGRGAAFPAHGSLARQPMIVAVEIDDREREGRIDLAAPLSYPVLERLFAARMVAEEHFGWNDDAGALLSRRLRRLDALVLEDRSSSVADHDERALPAMLETLERLGMRMLPWDVESRSLQARMQFVRALGRRELAGWPPSDDVSLLASLPQWLSPYLTGVTRRAHLSRLPLRAALLARLTTAEQRALEALAPRELVVPSGAAHQIDYLADNAPCLSVRLQEVFGLAEVPRIGAGTVPVTLQLLSPARRPVQITRDLAGFWRGSYAEVRRDLRGRYPKHHWPDNPLEAMPTCGTRRAAPKQGRARGV